MQTQPRLTPGMSIGEHMDRDLSKRWTEHWESRRHVAYDDATGKQIQPGSHLTGNPTIGVGLNLLTAAARIAIAGMGINYGAILSGSVALSDAQIDALLNQSQNMAIGDSRALFPEFDSYPDHQQLVIVDVCFNLGGPKFATFHQTCAAIRAKDWTGAAQNLQNSAWFHQVGSGPHQRGGADVAVLGGTMQPEEVLT
jgi:GH24 family phage-related lysozyme (muramidase)